MLTELVARFRAVLQQQTGYLTTVGVTTAFSVTGVWMDETCGVVVVLLLLLVAFSETDCCCSLFVVQWQKTAWPCSAQRHNPQQREFYQPIKSSSTTRARTRSHTLTHTRTHTLSLR